MIRLNEILARYLGKRAEINEKKILLTLLLKQGRRQWQREWQKSDRFRLAKQQLSTCTTLFQRRFLCRRCATKTRKCLFSRFVEHETCKDFFFFSQQPSPRAVASSQERRRHSASRLLNSVSHVHDAKLSHWLLYVACSLALRSSMTLNEGNKIPSLFFLFFFPNCCEKDLTFSETTCNEMANFVAKRTVTFLISRGPGFQPLDRIIQRINYYLADKY